MSVACSQCGRSDEQHRCGGCGSFDCECDGHFKEDAPEVIPPMRALTLTQPWAGLVASGIKLVENRPRRMIKHEDFGKPFAIHASRVIDQSVYKIITDAAPELAPRGPYSLADSRWYKLSRITSAVIAVATLRDAMYIGGCDRETILRAFERLGIPEQERRLGIPKQERFVFGPTVYVLSDVIALPKPVPCRGWQGFWRLTPELDAKVRDQLARAA